MSSHCLQIIHVVKITSFFEMSKVSQSRTEFLVRSKFSASASLALRLKQNSKSAATFLECLADSHKLLTKS